MNRFFPTIRASLLGCIALFLLIGARPAHGQFLYWNCAATPGNSNTSGPCEGYSFSSDGSAGAYASSAAACAVDPFYILGSSTEGDASVGPYYEGTAEVNSYVTSYSNEIYAYTTSTSEYESYTSAYAYADASPN